MEKVLNAGNGEAEQGDQVSASPLPEVIQDAGEVRSLMFSALADVEARADRRCDSLAHRVTKLESRGKLLEMPEEVKGFLVMLSLYVGVTFILPELARLVAEWRRRS